VDNLSTIEKINHMNKFASGTEITCLFFIFVTKKQSHIQTKISHFVSILFFSNTSFLLTETPTSL